MPVAAEPDRNLRKVSLLLDQVVQRDGRALTEHRALADHVYGTCHDFALLAVSALRERGIEARLRVGFARYFRPNRWEDHWVCEHRHDRDWAILDAQLGQRARAGFKVTFDVSDVPATEWRSAASIWRAIRAGKVEPGACGVAFAGITGAWSVATSLLRDVAGLAGVESLPRDYWGPGRDICASRQVRDDQAHAMDDLAAALDPAPADRNAATAALGRFPWARPTSMILSFPEGRDSLEVLL